MHDATFVNTYIEKLLKEIDDLTKNKILLQTQLAVTERINVDLKEQLEKFQKSEERYNKKKKQTENSVNESEITNQ